jgi:hypothetical protein
MKIIGLTGKAGSGKDSVADVLTGTFGFTRESFASDLKQAVLDLDPYVTADLERLSEIVNLVGMDEAKRTYPEVRRLLQVFGTEVIRARDEDFWVNSLQGRVMQSNARHFVITDVRFDNEAAWIRRSHGRVYEILRPGHEDAGAANGHASESGLDPSLVDDQILNDGTLEDLQLMVAGLVSSGTW